MLVIYKPESGGKIYKGEKSKGREALKSSMRWNQKFVYGWPCMEGKGKPFTLGDEVKIIDREEDLQIRCLKEAMHIRGYHDPLK